MGRGSRTATCFRERLKADVNLAHSFKWDKHQVQTTQYFCLFVRSGDYRSRVLAKKRDTLVPNQSWLVILYDVHDVIRKEVLEADCQKQECKQRMESEAKAFFCNNPKVDGKILLAFSSKEPGDANLKK